MPIVLDPDVSGRRLVARVTETLTREDVLDFLRTARASINRQSWPLLVDALGATTSLAASDIEAAVGIVEAAVKRDGMRAHVALVADDDPLYDWFLNYEMRCMDLGVRVIRVFRQRPDAERWLEVVSAARRFCSPCSSTSGASRAADF